MPQRDTPPAQSHTNLVLWLFLLTLVLAAIAVSALTAHRNLRTAWRNATTHQLEAYTQLYFTDPAHLPSYARAGKQQTVSFRIVNHERAIQTYTYEVRVVIANKTSTYRDTVTLSVAQAADRAVHFTIPTPSTRAQLTIELLGTNQSLTLRSSS